MALSRKRRAALWTAINDTITDARVIALRERYGEGVDLLLYRLDEALPRAAIAAAEGDYEAATALSRALRAETRGPGR